MEKVSVRVGLAAQNRNPANSDVNDKTSGVPGHGVASDLSWKGRYFITIIMVISRLTFTWFYD